MSQIECRPIGFVLNQVTDPVDENWGLIVSRLNIEPEYSKGVTCLGQFSHAIVLTFLNRAQFNAGKHLARRPRGLSTMPEVGIFAQRAKDRPNAIGITAVKIVNGEKALVRSVDWMRSTGFQFLTSSHTIRTTIS